jgi:hypothetical protein
MDYSAVLDAWKDHVEAAYYETALDGTPSEDT